MRSYGEAGDGPMSQIRSVGDISVLLVLVLLCGAAFIWDWFLMRAMFVLHMNDFGKFYYSARAFLAGRDMYEPSPATAVGVVGVPFLNMNPPHFHLLIFPLARLEPPLVVAIWVLASVFALVMSLIVMGRELEIRATPKGVLLTVLAALAFAPSQAFFITGQLSLLLLLPMTVCWRHARKGRWASAGVWLGACLSVKPFLLIFVPYFLGTRRTRALIATLATAATCFGAGLLLFGVGAYVSWIQALRQSGNWAWAGMNASTLGIFQRAFNTSPYFSPLLFEPMFVPFWIIVGGIIGIGTLLVAIEDESRSSTDRAFAILLVASQLVSPLGWVYYLWLPAGPIAGLSLCSTRPAFCRSSANRILAGVVLLGAFTSLSGIYYFQPNGWASVTMGSTFFLATLALWAWLLLDFAHSRAD